MSNSLKERIISTLLVSVTFFMANYIMYKLFDCREKWLTYSLMEAISWAIGDFVSRTISEVTANKIKVILFEVLISFVVALVMLFITRVISSVSNWYWYDIVLNIYVPFQVSLLINNRWKRD